MLPAEIGKLITQRRWLRFTPDRLIGGLLVLEGLLLLSEHFRWFAFNQHKGWTVLIAVASVGVTMLLMLLWFVASLVLRWRFQFSIRSLLVLTVAVAILCSWLSVEMKEARKQKEAVEAIGALKGGILYDWQISGSGKTKPTGPAWLRNVVGDDFFVSVNTVVSNTEFTDAVLQHLEGMTQLQYLYLGHTKVTDAGLEHFAGLTQLRFLGLTNTQVTDAGLAHLEGLTQLQHLEIGGTKVTDAGLEHLKELSQFQALGLDGTQVTDTGLTYLKS